MSSTTGRRVVWNTPSVTANGLKNFACIVMLLQNIGIVVIEKGIIHLEQYTQESLSQAMAADSNLMMVSGIASVLQLIGGMAIPIFAFLLVEGFLNTSSYKKYLLSIFIFALLSEIPYDLAMSRRIFDFSSQSAMVSMLISLLMLYVLKMVKQIQGLPGVFLQLLTVLGGILWVTFLRTEYGLCIILLAAIFYLLYARNGWKTLLGVLVSLMYVTGPLSFYGIWCYNGERKDKFSKYIYYIFYPVHLLLLALIARAVGA